MNLESCVLEAKNYRKSAQSYPLWIDFANAEDLRSFIGNFLVDRKISVEEYCNEDSMPRFENLYSDFRMEDFAFICNLSGFLKLLGSRKTAEVLSTLLSIGSKKIILTVQCRSDFRITDPRLKEKCQVLSVDGSPQKSLDVFFVPAPEYLPQGIRPYGGVHLLGPMFEQQDDAVAYILTSKKKRDFPEAKMNIRELNNAYEVLCSRIPQTANISMDKGTNEQWEYALGLLKENTSWEPIIDSVFGSHKSLEDCLHDFASMDDDKKWLFYIALRLFEPRNVCLKHVISKIASAQEIVRGVFRSIFDFGTNDYRYWDLYEARLKLLKLMKTEQAEFSDFCDVVRAKDGNILPYLTNTSQQEKELIFEYLDKNGASLERKELTAVLSHVYPELCDYLIDFDFGNDLLNGYFSAYKYQKLTNHIQPDFLRIVEEQAKERDYNSLLPSRSSLIEKLNFENSSLYFMDAMGVEYLGFIQQECNKKNLMADVKVCRAEVPSLTLYNKDFVEIFKNHGIAAKDIKGIDEIKHDGTLNYSYEKTKLPIYLIQELAIIEETLSRIQNELKSRNVDRCFMIADHGATRLAVVAQKDYDYSISEFEVPADVSHGGRVCKYSEDAANLEETTCVDTVDGKFCVVAGYKRFKGGRRPTVEVHGGATLEEVAVPIIEICLKRTDVEIWIETPEVTVGFGLNAKIKIASKTVLRNVFVEINGQKIPASEMSGQNFSFDVPKSIKAGEYDVKVFENGNLLKSDLKCKIKKKMAQERNLL